MAQQGFASTLLDKEVSLCCVAFLADYSEMWEGQRPSVVCVVLGSGLRKIWKEVGVERLKGGGAFPGSLCYLEWSL